MPTPARVRQIRSALVAMIEAWWTRGPDDEVIGSYIGDIDSDKLVGRKIHVIPEAYSSANAARGYDTDNYGYQIWVVEKCQTQGLPSESWIEERLDFVAELADRLGLVRKEEEDPPYLPTEPGVIAQEADVTTIYDIVDLKERKLFVSVVTILLSEDVPVT